MHRSLKQCWRGFSHANWALYLLWYIIAYDAFVLLLMSSIVTDLRHAALFRFTGSNPRSLACVTPAFFVMWLSLGAFLLAGILVLIGGMEVISKCAAAA